MKIMTDIVVSFFLSIFKALLDTWLGLWQWVFQPAIGVLMLGAVSYLLI